MTQLRSLFFYLPERVACYAAQVEMTSFNKKHLLQEWNSKAYQGRLKQSQAALAALRAELSEADQQALAEALDGVRQVADSTMRGMTGKAEIIASVTAKMLLLAEAEALNYTDITVKLTEQSYAQPYWTPADYERRLNLNEPDALAEFRRLNARPVSVLQVGGYRPMLDPLSSNLGLAPVMHPGEGWPLDLQGEPMEFIAQLNLTAAPHLPELLQDVQLLTFFVGTNFIETGCAEGTWALRTYAALNGLERREPPKRNAKHDWVAQGFEARWEPLATDFPCYDDLDLTLPEVDDDEDAFPDDAHGLNQRRTKLGGYPSSVQHSVEFLHFIEQDGAWHMHPDEPTYVFQIASEGKAGLNWVDDGVVYFGCHPATKKWSVTCQFY